MRSALSPRRPVAVFTGATGRLGVHLAAELIRNGHPLVAPHRGRGGESSERLLELRRIAGETGGRFVEFTGDIREPATAQRAFDLADGLGGCGLLVNGASIFDRGGLPSLDDALSDELLSTNLAAPLRLSRLAAIRMKALGGGRIVNILDVGGGVIPWSRGAAYCATRAGLAMATRCLALELAPLSIRVTGLAIGMTELTPEAMGADGGSAAVERIPMGRPALVREIAAALSFIADGPSDLSGTILSVDGGRGGLSGLEPGEWRD